MTLIIEDGSIVVNANSYVTVAEARAYALARGVTLSAVDSELEADLVLSMDYLESKGSCYKGVKTDPENQELQWPRYGAKIDGLIFPSDSIPKYLKNAQMQLSIEKYNDVDLMPTANEPFIIKEKVSVIETEYSEKINTSLTPYIQSVDALLEPICNTSGFGVKVIRV